MTLQEETAKENHDLLVDFLNATTNHSDPLNGYIKATICQFLLNLREELVKYQTESNLPTISREKLIEIQIEKLNECVSDLTLCLNRNKNLH